MISMHKINVIWNIILILKILIIYEISETIGDVITDFGDKKEAKYSLFGFDNQIPPENIQHWIYEGKVSASPIAFEPPSLDFPETPIGQPKWEHVKIINEDESSSIKLISISSNTVDFHCSFFKEEIIIEGGNSSFDIVFLSRHLGEIQSTLFIHTSRGTFQYKVTGIGIPSPYRIKSFLKARIPINGSFSSPIHFYNPHNYPIQVLEMYTSGGDAHLELPSNGKEASKKFWTVPPYETRTLMKVKFFGRKVGNFTSYIRIRTNTTDNSLGFVIPLQMEISNKSLLYCTNDILNFGILRTLDSPKVLKLLVVNSAMESIRIKNISLSKPNDAISIDFHQIKIPPGIYQHTTAATVTFSAFKATSKSDFNGDLIVETFQNQTLKIPYSADIIHGSLVYDANNTKFFTGIGKEKTEIRSIAITNTFSFTIAIYSISLPSKPNSCFQILNISLPIFIKSQMTERSIEVQFIVNNDLNPLITQMAIFSNASLFVIPLFVYDGKLTIISHRPEMYKGYLDFGTLGVNVGNSLDFTIKNENPIEISIFSMSANWYLSTIFLIGVEKGNSTLLQKNHSYQPMTNFVPLILKPYHFAVFTLNVLTPDTKGVFASEISIVTSYEKLSIPYYLRTTDGVITSVNTLSLKNSFPTKVSKLFLTLNSSFQSYIELTSVNFIPNDTRFDYDPRSGRKLPILINPIEPTHVGYVTFSPDNNCIDPLSDEFIDLEKSTSVLTKSVNIQFRILNEINGKVPCYVGFNVCTKLGYQWLHSVDMNSNTYDIDHFVYKRLNQQWEVLKSTDNDIFNITMQMDTSNIKGFLYNVQIQFVWPSLLQTFKIIKFSLTQIGNFSFKDIYLENPSDKSVLVQLIPISQYPDSYSMLELLGISDKDIEISNSDVFTLHPKKSLHDQYIYNESIKESYKVKKMFSFAPHNESIVFYLSSKSKQKMRIYFNPMPEHFGSKISTFILLRNNLTGIETLRLEGEGTYGELSFQGGQFPEETSVLNFDLTEKHLKSCDSQSKGLPSFTVRRPFVIKNIGKIPVYILGFQFGPVLNLYENQAVLDLQMNDSYSSPSLSSNVDNIKSEMENIGESVWCAGYGFEILECYEHRLEVNETLKLEIVFTPDFSLHKVIQQLQIHTSLSDRPFNITVHATLPAHMLHKCSQALARPDSEVLIWYMGIVVLSIVSVASIIMSYYEADRIFTSNVIYRHLSSVAVGNYHHSSSDRLCDFRTLVSKNSPFIGTSSQLHISHKPSSVQDYLSMYNRTSKDTNTVKRVNSCKKIDERLSNSLTEKQFSQSFCGKSISDDLTNFDCNVSSLVANTIHQHKRKKKRNLFSNLVQWFFRSCNQMAHQNSALKPKLDNNYILNYKNEVQSSIQSVTLSNKIDEKNDKNNIINNKIKENTSTGTMQQNNTSSNNNSNHPGHSKKLKNRPLCTVLNQNKLVNKQNDQTVATLNFAPIDIPALDIHKCKKFPNNKKLKKNSAATTEEIKVKSSMRMDDSISISTDSSTDEKIKEIEGNKNPVVDLSKSYNFKQDSKNLSLEGFIERKIKTNKNFEPDDESSLISNDSGIESTKNILELSLEKLALNRKNTIKLEKNIPEQFYQGSMKHNVVQNPNHVSAYDVYQKKSKAEMKESKMTNFENTNAIKDQRSSFMCNEDVLVKENNLAYENNDMSDDFVQWENENVTQVTSDDFAMLSENTALFSNFVALNDTSSINTVHVDEKPDVNLKSNIECWLSTTNTPANNISAKYNQTNDVRNNTCLKNNNTCYCDDSHFINNRGCNIHDEENNLQMPTYRNLYKQTGTFNNNTLLHKLSHNDIYNQDFMSLELPGIAYDRKKSLLDYERRLQKETTESERISTIQSIPEYGKDNFLSMKNAVDQYWDLDQHNDTSRKDQIWNSTDGFSNQRKNIMDNWLTDKSWNQIEPGSQHDSLARNLLPRGLLSNDNTHGIFSNSPDNLWKFKSIDSTNKQTDSYEMMDSSMER